MELYRIDQKNRKSVDDFIMKQWFTLDRVVQGEKINLGNADGFYASEDNRIVGLITYRIANNEMEIMSLDSLNEKKGIGTSLLDKAIQTAKDVGCLRIMLITTNDIPIKHEIELEMKIGR